LLAVAMVIALVLANMSAKKLSSLPAMPSSKTPAFTSSSTPSSSATFPTESSETANVPVTETVVYNVTGQGRAISIAYVDNGGVLQTEFNVALPWSKEVNLSSLGDQKANITIVNIGHDVTCSVTVAGVEVRQHTGMGLTVCDAAS
jgi:hypothetical protein